MAQKNKHANKQMKKLTRQQKADRIKAAQAREAQNQKRRESESRTKKIITVVVCVILVLALGIPTMALTVLSGGR